MTSKGELQDTLKEQFGINKNISQSLSQEDCQQILDLLYKEPSTVRLVESYVNKNSELKKNNGSLGTKRHSAERKFEKLQIDYRELEESIESSERRFEELQIDYRELEESVQSIEAAKLTLEQKKRKLEAEQKELTEKVQELASKNQILTSEVQTLDTRNNQLTIANTGLMKENKDLKNVVDQIKLRMAHNIQELMEYEDNQIRKALLKLFQWTLG